MGTSLSVDCDEGRKINTLLFSHRDVPHLFNV